MKKILSKVGAVALAAASIFVVGCGSTDVISKRAINACKTYLNDLEVLQTEIDYHIEYGYDAAGAQAAAIAVGDSDLSQFGITYADYNAFNFADGSANGHYIFSPQVLYGGAIGVLTNLDRYIDYLNEDNFSINQTYKFLYSTGDEYFSVNFNDNTLYAYIEKTGYQKLFTIKLAEDSTDWQSVEMRAVSFHDNGEEEYKHYYYIEKSTNDSRVFDRCANILWRIESTAQGKDQISAFDFEEKTQKMLFEDDSFYPEDLTTGVTKSLYDYMQTLDFTSFINAINKDNATEIKI